MNDVFEHSLRTQEIIAAAENYNRWIYGTLRPYLGRRIVDVGCSIGNITRFFLDRERVLGIDISPAAVERLRARFARVPHFSALVGDIMDPELAGRLAAERPDTVVSLNVIEHIEDDVTALAHMRSMLVTGGRVVLVVPALMTLYGSMDSADGHFRRYELKSFRRSVEAAGLRLEKAHYFNFLGMFGWFVNGRILRRQYVPDDQLQWFDRLVPFVRRIEERLRPAVGQSLFGVARKA